MKVLLLLLILCASTAYGGVVSTTSCGGVGTWQECRIDGCEGTQCNMTPGVPYSVEADFITSSASPALCLDVTTMYLGFPVEIISTELANSSVGAGQLYTVRFIITPNDVLSGNELPVSASIGRCNSGLIETCRTVKVYVI